MVMVVLVVLVVVQDGLVVMAIELLVLLVQEVKLQVQVVNQAPRRTLSMAEVEVAVVLQDKF